MSHLSLFPHEFEIEGGPLAKAGRVYPDATIMGGALNAT